MITYSVYSIIKMISSKNRIDQYLVKNIIEQQLQIYHVNKSFTSMRLITDIFFIFTASRSKT